MEYWKLPGPAAFASAIADAVVDGCNVIVASPATTGSVVAKMIDEHDGWGLGANCHCVASGRPPIDDLFDALDIDERIPGNRTIAALMARLNRSHRVIVSGLSSEWIGEWMKFVNEYASACRAVGKFERTQIIVLLVGAPKHVLPARAPALEVFTWDGWVGEADVLGYIARRWRAERRVIDIKARLAARIVTRLAMWDFDLVDRLMELSMADLFDPTPRLSTMTREEAVGLVRSWESGGIGQFDGENQVHSLVLANEGDPEGELSMRLWAAQAAELLPLLEIRRRDLVKRMRGGLGLSLRMELNGAPVTDLDDVEIGGLAFLASRYRFPRPVVDEANRLRLLRNRLAHLCPVTIDEAQAALDMRR
jgi:hypothetical protein